MILILIKHTAANSAHGGQQENLITTDRILCAMVLVTNYLSRISISIDLCIYSFRSLKRKNRCHSANKCVCIWGLLILTSAPWQWQKWIVAHCTLLVLIIFCKKNKSEKVTLRPKTWNSSLLVSGTWVLFLGSWNWMY